MDAFVGEIRMFAGNFAPSGWALCDGQLLRIEDHQALYSLLGNEYGGDGRQTFALPDMRGRAGMHQGSSGPLPRRRTGETGGGEIVRSSEKGVMTTPYCVVSYIICLEGLYPSRS